MFNSLNPARLPPPPTAGELKGLLLGGGSSKLVEVRGCKEGLVVLLEISNQPYAREAQIFTRSLVSWPPSNSWREGKCTSQLTHPFLSKDSASNLVRYRLSSGSSLGRSSRWSWRACCHRISAFVKMRRSGHRVHAHDFVDFAFLRWCWIHSWSMPSFCGFCCCVLIAGDFVSRASLHEMRGGM